jgi:hypothetical protein
MLAVTKVGFTIILLNTAIQKHLQRNWWFNKNEIRLNLLF